MTKPKKLRIETVKSNPEKRDMLTEMFEHFGIKVINVNNQNSKSDKGRRGRYKYEKR